MKKNGESRKNRAGAAAGVKPDAVKAKAKAAKVAADKGKCKGNKSDKGATPDNGDIALDVLFKGLGVASGEEVELLREIAKGIKSIADRVESVRRTLWRMSEVRDYKGAGDKPEAAKESAK